jgi:hypothetical protein
VEHALLAQTWVPGQVVLQLPQWLLSEATQAPPQFSNPAAQVHWPP